MLFDTSYYDKKTVKQINAAVGQSFSFKERLKLRGIGSGRMTISAVTKEYQKYLNASHYQSKANLEIRPKGLIVHFRHKLQSYSWIMPFSTLNTENSDHLQLKSDGKHISFSEKLKPAFYQKIQKIRDRGLK